MSAPPTRYPQEIEIVNHFINRLERRLAGREELTLVNRLPIDECHLGVLAPWRNPDEAEPLDAGEMAEGESPAAPLKVARAVPLAAPNPKAETSGEADDEEPEVRRAPVERVDDQDVPRRPPSALGCELMLTPVDGKVSVTVNLSFAFYTTHLPTYRQQLESLGGTYRPGTAPKAPTPPTPVPKGKRGKQSDTAMTLAYALRRNAVQLENLTFTLDATKMTEQRDAGRIQTALDDAITRALVDRPAPENTMATRAGAQLTEADLKDEPAFEKFIAAHMRDKKPGRPDPALQASLMIRTEPQANGNVRVSLYLSNDTLRNDVRTQDNVNILADARLWGDVTQGMVAPIEILPIPRDYQYDRRVWGVGHNTSVTIDQHTGHFETHALARFDQPRLTTKDHLPTEFGRFAENTFDVLAEIYAAMEAEVTHWQDKVLGANSEGLTPEELIECQTDFERFQGEVHRFAAGIAALRAQPELLRAFQAMNRVMGRIAAKKGFDRWRLFQIAFIVTQLPALALRENVSEGEDHLGHHHDWTGDLDIADVLWFPTGGGKTESYLGLICCAILYDRLRGKTMGVTAWLRFPLRMLSVQQLQRAVTMIHEAQIELDGLGIQGEHDKLLLGYFVGSSTTPNTLDDKFFKDHATPESCEKFKMIADCPKCGGKGTVKMEPRPKQSRLYHRCQDPKCMYYLPVVITDAEIYRTLPALIVGTVDKAATLGMQERFGILWAGPRWKCPTHGYGNIDFCIYGCDLKMQDIAKLPLIQPKDPSPTLHLQDELHLLQEELGAFAGHYETLIRYCEEQAGGKKSKVIAATATIEGFEHQTRHLYGVRDARRFPSRGYKRHENFYAKIEETAPGVAKTARVFVAFRPSGLSTEAAARCARILNSTVTKLFEEEAATLAALKETTTPGELAALRHYYSMSLTYVASLTGGTRVKDFLNDASKEILNGARDLGVRYLSGRSSTGEIAGVIEEIESPEDWKSALHVDALVATNVISHGVDLERCNLMVMEKYPAETAEYIQASSRSGRKKVGLVVVVLPVRNLRASSIYSRFQEYHQHLDRMVTPVPVNRFAKQALRRTLSGTVAGLIYGLAMPTEKDKPQKTRMTQLKNVTQALKWLDRPLTPGGAHLWITDHLRGAQALGDSNYDAELESGQVALIDEAYGLLHARLVQHTKTAARQNLGDALNPKPMTSLRDVERSIPFRPDSVPYDTLDWFEHSGK
ncbi:C-terminal helicase domain-containing protein [Deinococcus aquatilis]|uniref:C-terminal helicase domain-containing protein n=1 Tax=Deinococcus aquatilis TaxID=519440 RepID=UPI00037B5FBC|nr:helicase-related protein [Deinococcus aquatilis]